MTIAIATIGVRRPPVSCLANPSAMATETRLAAHEGRDRHSHDHSDRAIDHASSQGRRAGSSSNGGTADGVA